MLRGDELWRRWTTQHRAPAVLRPPGSLLPSLGMYSLSLGGVRSPSILWPHATAFISLRGSKRNGRLPSSSQDINRTDNGSNKSERTCHIPHNQPTPPHSLKHNPSSSQKIVVMSLGSYQGANTIQLYDVRAQYPSSTLTCQAPVSQPNALYLVSLSLIYTEKVCLLRDWIRRA